MRRVAIAPRSDKSASVIETRSFGGIIVSTMTPERSLDIYFQYVTDADGVKKAVDELRRSNQLGFDTETTELDPYKGKLKRNCRSSTTRPSARSAMMVTAPG